jgi:hypothetical protein
MHSRVLWYFHIGSFVISRVIGFCFSNLTFSFNIKSWKAAGVCFSHASALVVSVLFQWRVWRHWLSKNRLLSCHCKCCHMLLFLIWSVSVVVWWFVAGSRFFFFLSTFLSLLVKVHVCPFFFLFSISVLMFFIAYFHPWLF